MFGNGNGTGTYTQSRSNGVSVNTRLITLYSDDSMVSVVAWNGNLSVKFHPATGKNADGVTQYTTDNNNIVPVVITPDNARALLEGINKEVIPALNNKGTASVAIRTGSGNNTKFFAVGCEEGNPYIYVARNLMDGVTEDTNVIWHKFSTRTYFSNYSYKNGTMIEVPVNTGFINFVKRLENIDNLVPDVAHTINYSNAIRSSLANSFSSNNNSGNSFSSNSFGSSNTNTYSQSKYEAPVNNFEGSSSEEFLPFA